MSTPTDVDTSTFRPVIGIAQEVSHTASRRSGPRKWLRAVQWLIGAGLHPKTNATTQAVADDLAARMDYTTGHARYLLDEMADRLEVSRATVKRHVGYLRELGALAWVQHGTRINIRRAMGLKGYAATATVYAAVIPPVFDHAMGHTIVGTGYSARIVIDQRGRQTYNEAAQTYNAEAVVPVDNSPVDNPGCEGLEPPSLTWVEEDGKLKVVEGCNYTSQARRDHESPIPSTNSSSDRPTGLKGSTGRTPAQAAEDIRAALKVRPLVTWTQRENARRLAVAIRPLIDEGLDWYTIAVRLNNMGPGEKWRPRRPAAYITRVLAEQAERTHRQQAAEARYELENPAPGAFQASRSAQQMFMAALDKGIAIYQQQMRARGHEDLCTPHLAPTGVHTEADAAADILAFLNGSPA